MGLGAEPPGHFHYRVDDFSGAHTTGWVPYMLLKEMQEESAVVKRVVQRFLDMSFSRSEEAFDCSMPQTFTVTECRNLRGTLISFSLGDNGGSI